MSQAYTPGLKVTPATRWRCRRLLPIAGRVFVAVGQRVEAEDVIAETVMPGDVTPVNAAKQLGIPAGELAAALLQPLGSVVTPQAPMARATSLFGLFTTEARVPVTGTLESVSAVTGMVIVRGEPLRVQVRAYLAGTVVEVIPNEGAVIEAEAAVIQGIFGVGGEAYGVIHPVCDTSADDLTPQRLTGELRGRIVIGGRRVTREAVSRALALGVSAIVTGGIDDADLREILGYDLGVAVTGMERIGLTIIVTEGFGEIAMARRTFELLRRHVGQRAAVNGATQIRAGVMRPEIVIPLTERPLSTDGRDVPAEGLLVPGAPVRIIREPHFGALGAVTELPSEPQTLASESKARVIVVTLATGGRVTVPRANVELIEE